MIRLHKDDRELLVRIDLDAAPPSLENLWAAYEKVNRMAQRCPSPEVLDLMRIAYGTVLLAATQLLADTCTGTAAECADRADNPDTDAKSVVH